MVVGLGVALGVVIGILLLAVVLLWLRRYPFSINKLRINICNTTK